MLKLPELMLNLFWGGLYTFYLVFVHVFIFSAWRRLVFKGPRGIKECEFAKKSLETSLFVIPIHLHVPGLLVQFELQSITEFYDSKMITKRGKLTCVPRHNKK